jgi:putative membrane protein
MMRLLIRWALNALALLGVAYVAGQLNILPGFRVEGFEAAAVAVAILTLLNMTVRPLIKLFALPITCLTFGLFTLVINAAMMMLTDRLVAGFEVGTFWNALLVSLAYALVSSVLNSLIKTEGANG